MAPEGLQGLKSRERACMRPSEKDRKEVGAKIREVRERRGMTQRELTDATCSSTSIVSNWLSGTRSPNAESLAAFCRATGASADWLLGTRRP